MLRTICFLLLTSMHLAAGCGGCNPYWLTAEYLYGKIRHDKPLIPLVVMSPVVPDGAPVLGIPGSKVVLGDERIESKWRSGARFTFGFSCNEYCPTGVEVSYFFLGKSSTAKCVFSDGTTSSSFLSVPFINSNTGLESSLAIAVPGSFSGTARYSLSNMMQGAELNAVSNVTFFDSDLDVFGGVRYINFTERFHFNTDSPFINPALNNVYFTRDKFHVDNNFYGVQVGATLTSGCGPFYFNVKGKLAIGAISQSSHIQGKFVLNDFTNFTIIQEFKGGFFALPSNIGHHERTRFAVVPEVNVNVGYEIIPELNVFLGYDFLYISNIVRAARQLDRKLNPTQSALYSFTPAPIRIGAKLPKGALSASDLWVQCLTVGLEFIY